MHFNLIFIFLVQTNLRNVFGDSEQPAPAAAPAAAAPFPAPDPAPEPAPVDPATQTLYKIQQQVMELEKQARNGLKNIEKKWLNAGGKTMDMNHQG